MFYVYPFAIIALLIILYAALVFNTLQKLEALTNEAWSGVDVQLNRRYSLIPNLVSLVKAYAEKELDILESVTRLRTEAMNTVNRETEIDRNVQLGNMLNKINVVVENYPEIKSNDNFLQLQNQLFEIEDQIQLSRRYYNGTVRNYNIAVSVFPNNIFAFVFGKNKKPFFEAEEAAREHKQIEL